MNRTRLSVKLLVAATLIPVAAACLTSTAREGRSLPKQWTDDFHTASCAWSSTGRNAFFVLEPGHQDVYDGLDGTESVHLEITVLQETRTIAGVETRVLEERESKNGELAEVSRNFFAFCGEGGDAFYFGEEVDIYRGGVIVSHEGAWNADEPGNQAGLFMPAHPLLGARCFQEIAPGIAMDRIEVISDSETLVTPAGTFHDCLKTEETTPLEPGVKDYKVYAPGVGMIRDGSLLLTRSGQAGTTSR